MSSTLSTSSFNPLYEYTYLLEDHKIPIAKVPFLNQYDDFSKPQFGWKKINKSLVKSLSQPSKNITFLHHLMLMPTKSSKCKIYYSNPTLLV